MSTRFQLINSPHDIPDARVAGGAPLRRCRPAPSRLLQYVYHFCWYKRKTMYWYHYKYNTSKFTPLGCMLSSNKSFLVLCHVEAPCNDVKRSGHSSSRHFRTDMYNSGADYYSEMCYVIH